MARWIIAAGGVSKSAFTGMAHSRDIGGVGFRRCVRCATATVLHRQCSFGVCAGRSMVWRMATSRVSGPAAGIERIRMADKRILHAGAGLPTCRKRPQTCVNSLDDKIAFIVWEFTPAKVTNASKAPRRLPVRGSGRAEVRLVGNFPVVALEDETWTRTGIRR